MNVRKKFLVKTTVISLIFLLLLGLAGCSYQQVVDFLLPPPEQVSELEEVEILPVKDDSIVQDEEGIGEKYTLVLFFSDQVSGKLVAEKREVAKVEGLARKAVHELISGPKNSKLNKTLPTGTKLRDINIKPEGLCIVDFSKELQANHPGGSSGELQTVYSIVNTLTQFSTVKEVQILIEGQQIESLAGHMDINQPLERDHTFISGE